MTLVLRFTDGGDHFVNHSGTVGSLGNTGRRIGSQGQIQHLALAKIRLRTDLKKEP